MRANSQSVRTIRYTPAVTIVAAWMRAETGVGPSIASGSQTCRKNWALLPIAPMNSSAATASTARTLKPPMLSVKPGSAAAA